jgi:phage/plasmid-like protein (TIGR03299 family)
VDKVEKYVLFSTGHDGRTSLQIRFTPVRVVCKNTLMLSLVGTSDLFKIHHVPGMRTEIAEAQAEVERILKEYGHLAETYGKFADKTLKDDDLKSYLSAVFPDPKRKKGQTERSYASAVHKVKETRDAAAKLFKKGRGNDRPPAQGTLWAAYNGIVELVDHYWSYSSP